MSITNVPIDKVIQVDITKQLVVPSLEDFGLFCLMSEDIAVIPIIERYRVYDDLDAIIADWGTTSPEYYAARSFFEQSPEPVEFMIATVDTVGETYVEAIADAYLKNQFYGIGLVNLALSDVDFTAIAEYVQTQLMLLFYQTDDLVTLPTAIKTLGLNRTSLFYYEAVNAPNRHDLAMAGFGMTRAPGSFNWANNSLIGITPTSATIAEIEAGLDQSLNFYLSIAKVPLTRLGKVSGADDGILYLDEITGIDWLKIAIQQEVYQSLVSLPKIPYTDDGLNIIEGNIKNVLTNAVSLEILSGAPTPTVSHIPVSEVPVADKQARRSPTFNFTAVLAGAVNYIKIVGTLSV